MPLKQFKVSESRWGAIAVSLAVFGMLVAFYLVVRSATTAGELRRQDAAARTAALMRCHALPNGPIRKQCLGAANDQMLATSPIMVAAQ